MKNITRQMISDITNLDFYVKKSFFVNPINCDIIKMKSYNDNYYKIDINYTLHERYMKIYKINKSEKLKNILDIISICKKNKTNWSEVIESQMNIDIKKSRIR